VSQPSPSNVVIVPPRGTNQAVEGLRPPRGLVDTGMSWAWLGWLVLALVLAGLVWAMLKRRKRRVESPPPPVPPVPAHVRARERILQARAWIEQPKPFCIAVSDALRLYLEESLRLRAPERTTEEFLDELQASAQLSREQKRALAEFLERCDLVKFARDEPSLQDLEALQNSALRLVDETAAFAGAADVPRAPAGGGPS